MSKIEVNLSHLLGVLFLAEKMLSSFDGDISTQVGELLHDIQTMGRSQDPGLVDDATAAEVAEVAGWDVPGWGHLERHHVGKIAGFGVVAARHSAFPDQLDAA